MQVLSSLSGILFYAPSAGFAPTNSADVSAIASSYADSAASGKLDATASSQFLTAVPADYATTADVESAVSSKQDSLTFGYDASDKISSVNGSALAGGGGGGGLVTSIGSLDGHITSINSSDIVGRPSAVLTRSADENILQTAEYMAMGDSKTENRWFSDSLGINKVYLKPNHTSNAMSATAYDTYENEVGVVPLTATALTISSDTAVIVRLVAQSDENGLSMHVSGFKFSPSGDYIEALPSMDSCVLKSESVVRLGTEATATGDDYDVKFAQGTASAGNIGFAFGSYASAEYSVAFGSNSIGGYTSLAAGSNVSAYSDSLAVGDGVSATYTSMAQGNYASAFDNSFARGLSVSAINSATVFGQYNLSGDGSGESGAAFVIGDGDEYALHDLMVVTKDGEITMYSSTADTAGTGIMSSIRAISAATTGGGTQVVSSLQYKAIPITATATASGGPLVGDKVSSIVLSLYPDTAIGAPLYTELSSITSFDLQLSGGATLNSYFGQNSADTVAVIVKASALDKYQWSIQTSDYQLLGTLRDASVGLLSDNTYTASIQIKTPGLSSNTWADGQTFDDQHPYIAIQSPSGMFLPLDIMYASGTAGYYGGNGGTAISGVNEYPLYAQMSYQTQLSYQTAYASASATQATAQDVLYILLPDGV